MREVTNSGNIGSIITMLIDEQHVNIEDILTEEQFRQDCQHQSETKIKEEVEPTLTDFGSNNYHHDFPFSVGQSYRATDTNVWSNGAMAGIHSDQSSDVQSGLEKGGVPDKLTDIFSKLCSEPADSAFSNNTVQTALSRRQHPSQLSQRRQILGEKKVGKLSNTRDQTFTNLKLY